MTILVSIMNIFLWHWEYNEMRQFEMIQQWHSKQHCAAETQPCHQWSVITHHWHWCWGFPMISAAFVPCMFVRNGAGIKILISPALGQLGLIGLLLVTLLEMYTDFIGTIFVKKSLVHWSCWCSLALTLNKKRMTFQPMPGLLHCTPLMMWLNLSMDWTIRTQIFMLWNCWQPMPMSQYCNPSWTCKRPNVSMDLTPISWMDERMMTWQPMPMSLHHTPLKTCKRPDASMDWTSITPIFIQWCNSPHALMDWTTLPLICMCWTDLTLISRIYAWWRCWQLMPNLIVLLLDGLIKTPLLKKTANQSNLSFVSKEGLPLGNWYVWGFRCATMQNFLCVVEHFLHYCKSILVALWTEKINLANVVLWLFDNSVGSIVCQSWLVLWWCWVVWKSPIPDKVFW